MASLIIVEIDEGNNNDIVIPLIGFVVDDDEDDEKNGEYFFFCTAPKPHPDISCFFTSILHFNFASPVWVGRGLVAVVLDDDDDFVEEVRIEAVSDDERSGTLSFLPRLDGIKPDIITISSHLIYVD